MKALVLVWDSKIPHYISTKPGVTALCNKTGGQLVFETGTVGTSALVEKNRERLSGTSNGMGMMQ